VLWDAAKDSNLLVVKVLMELQVNALAKDEEGNTALHMAVWGGHVHVLGEIVLEGGLEVLMAKNNFGLQVTLLPNREYIRE
jgi:ankyrin repeat protein